MLAGGCYWRLDAVYRSLRGLTDVTSGFADHDQRTAFEAEIRRAQEWWPDPVATEIAPLRTFYPAPEDTQDYFAKKPQIFVLPGRHSPEGRQGPQSLRRRCARSRPALTTTDPGTRVDQLDDGPYLAVGCIWCNLTTK